MCSEEVIEKIRAEVKAGGNRRDIAFTRGISLRCVEHHTLDLPKNYRGRVKLDPNSSHEILEMKKEYMRGVSISVIAKSLGVPDSQVEYHTQGLPKARVKKSRNYGSGYFRKSGPATRKTSTICEPITSFSKNAQTLYFTLLAEGYVVYGQKSQRDQSGLVLRSYRILKKYNYPILRVKIRNHTVYMLRGKESEAFRAFQKATNFYRPRIIRAFDICKKRDDLEQKNR